MLFKDKNKNFMNEEFSDREYAMLDFELIEDEIDIDSIEEITVNENYSSAIINEDNIHLLFEQQNKLVQAVKQLNKEVKELKETRIRDIREGEKLIDEAIKSVIKED